MLNTIKPSDQSAAGEDNKQKEVSDPNTGQPTRWLTQDEYREWVRDAVSGAIWRRFAAILSIFGVATFYGIWTYTERVSNREIDSRFEILRENAKTNASEQTANFERLKNSLSEAMGRQINVEINTQVKTHQLVDAIANSATSQTVKALTNSEFLDAQLRNLIVTQAQNILKDPKSALRELALQQILLFGHPQQRAEAVAAVLNNPNSDPRLFSLALDIYELPREGRDHRDLLDNVLSRALAQPAALTEANWRSLQNFLKEDRYVEYASRWVRDRSAMIGANERPALLAIVKRIAQVGELTAATQFVEWTTVGNEALTNLGLEGLTALRSHGGTSPTDTKIRHDLVRRAIGALARADREREGLSDYLSRLFSALRQKDQAALTRYGASEFATARIRDLVLSLARDNRSASWSFVDREIRSPDDLRRVGNFERSGLSAQTFSALAALLSVSTDANDWQTLVLPIVKDAKDGWTSRGPARLLLNAWVHRLRSGDAPPQAVHDVAMLFVNTHSNHDEGLFLSENFASYRFLLSKANDEVIRSLLDRAPRVIGVAYRAAETAEFYDENEATILSEVLARSLRDQLLTEDHLIKLRAGLNDMGRQQRSQAIWVAAVAQAAGMRDASPREPNWRRTFLALADRARNAGAKDGLSQRSAATLLFLMANSRFLTVPAALSAAEVANLHLLADDVDRANVEPYVGRLAKLVSSEAGSALPWLGRLEQLSPQRVEREAVELTQDVTWLSFSTAANRLAYFSIAPALPSDATATVVKSDGRVFEAQIVRPRDGRGPTIARVPYVEPGPTYLRVRLPLLRQNVVATLRHDVLYRASAQPSRETAPEIKSGDVVLVQSSGADEVVLRLNATVSANYLLRTFDLSNSIDTEIEVLNPGEERAFASDDDGGDGLASLLSLRSDRNGAYHIRIKNIARTAGTFAFEVVER
jgi:hypothetical protein